MTGAVYAGIVAVGIASLVSDPCGEEQGTGWYGLLLAMPGIRDRVDPAHSDFTQSRSRRAAAHIARHYRFCLHRLDVRSPRIYGERSQCLRLYLLHYFRHGID